LNVNTAFNSFKSSTNTLHTFLLRLILSRKYVVEKKSKVNTLIKLTNLNKNLLNLKRKEGNGLLKPEQNRFLQARSMSATSQLSCKNA